MKKFNFIVMFLFCFLSFSGADEKKPNLFWDGGSNAHLATLNDFSIRVIDEVSDGCMPQPSKLKDQMEISLRKNGFAINPENNSLDPIVSIRAIGHKSGSLCIVYLESILQMTRPVMIPYTDSKSSLVLYNYQVGSVLLSGDKPNMQQRLEKEIQGHGDQLFLDISRAKDDIFAKFPFIKENMDKKN